MYEPQSRSRRYLNDMIYNNSSLAGGWGTGGGQLLGRGTPLLLPQRSPV